MLLLPCCCCFYYLPGLHFFALRTAPELPCIPELLQGPCTREVAADPCCCYKR